MHKKILYFLIITCVPLVIFASQNKNFDLIVIHTNDIHAHLLPINESNGFCSKQDETNNKCFGGVAKRATVINNIRENNKNVLLLDAGDQFQGTLFFLKYEGKESSYFLNKLGYQAITFGNHEFDIGSRKLARYIKELVFPMVSANVDVSKDQYLKGLVKPYTIIDVNGQKIGVTGCTVVDTTNTSNPSKSVQFNDITSSVVKVVNELKTQGINKIILICHQGYEADKELASNLDGVDIIVGGHSHTYLSSSNFKKGNYQAKGRYPTVVNSLIDEPVLIVQDYMYGKYLGKLDVTFNKDGIPIKWSGEPILLNNKIKANHEISKEVAKFNAPLERMRQKIIGKSTINIGSNCRTGECNFGDLIADAMLDFVGDKAEIAIINGGAVRSGVGAGNIRYSDVLEALPFDSTIVTFNITGKFLLEGLENGFSRFGFGGFPQVAGLKVWWNPERPIGKKIIKVKVRQKNGNYLPLEKNKVYKVVTVDFVQKGGDGYIVFAKNLHDLRIYYNFTFVDVIINYIEKHSPIQHIENSRINLSSG